MPLWGANTAAVSNAMLHTNDHIAANSVNRTLLFNNTNAGACYGNMVFTVYGVSNVAANVAGFSANTSRRKININPGWVAVRQWMGPAGNLAVTFAGNTYVNGQILTLTSTVTGTINASAVISTNAAGAIIGLALANTNSHGKAGLFVNTSTTTVGFTNSTGGSTGLPTGANIATATFVLGGRANRYHVETLIAMTSASGNSSSNTSFFPIAASG